MKYFSNVTKNYLLYPFYCCILCETFTFFHLQERWLSILRHIVNKHEWTVSTEYTSCEHDKLSDEDAREKEWLKSGSASHKALQAIVTDKRTLKDMELVNIHVAEKCEVN